MGFPGLAGRTGPSMIFFPISPPNTPNSDPTTPWGIRTPDLVAYFLVGVEKDQACLDPAVSFLTAVHDS